MRRTAARAAYAAGMALALLLSLGSLRGLEAAPSPAQTAINETLGHIEAGHLEAALERIQQALKAEPDRVEAHLLYVRLMIETGKRSAVQAEYGKRKDEHRDALSLVLYSRTQEDLATQERLLMDAEKLDPSLGWVHYCLATLRVQQRKPKEAVAALEKAVAVQPDFSQALESLGTLYVALGEPDKAIASYRQATSLSPENAQTLYQLGSLLARQGKVQEGRTTLEQSYRLAPDNLLVMNNLAFLYFKEKRYDESLALYDKVLAKAPEYSEARLNRAVVARVKQGDISYDAVTAMERAMTSKSPEDAIREYKKVIQLSPRFELPHLALGQIYTASKQMEDAEKSFLKAVELNPSYPEAVRMLSEFYLLTGKGEKAEPTLKRALALQPRSPELLAALGTVYLQQARYAEAEGMFAGAVALLPAPLTPPLRLNRARAIALQGRYKDAVMAFNELLKTDPDYVGARVELASTYFALEDFASARKHYEWVLRIEPDNKAVKQLLETLQAREKEVASHKGSLRARQIMVRTEKEAQSALADLKGGREFTAVMVKTTSPGQASGELGYFKKGELLPQIEAAVTALKPGEYSGIVKTPAGYHILMRLQ